MTRWSRDDTLTSRPRRHGGEVASTDTRDPSTEHSRSHSWGWPGTRPPPPPHTRGPGPGPSRSNSWGWPGTPPPPPLGATAGTGSLAAAAAVTPDWAHLRKSKAEIGHGRNADHRRGRDHRDPDRGRVVVFDAAAEREAPGEVRVRIRADRH